MTNEQAIKELQESHDIMRNHDIDESESYLMQALNMAIKALQTQADGEKTCGTCRNEDTYHCAECENKSDYEQAQAEVNAHVIQSALDNGTNTVIGTAQADNIPVMYYPQVDGITPTVVAQADGEYISKDTVIEWLKEKDIIKMVGQEKEARKQLDELPSVAIPPDHDGCEDCRWQSQSEIEMPCKQCMHNYTDEWERAKTGHWIWQPSNKEQGERDFIWWKCSECGQVIYSETEKDRREYHAFCGRCGKRMIEPQEISYTVEQELNEYTGNIEIIEKKY